MSTPPSSPRICGLCSDVGAIFIGAGGEVSPCPRCERSAAIQGDRYRWTRPYLVRAIDEARAKDQTNAPESAVHAASPDDVNTNLLLSLASRENSDD